MIFALMATEIASTLLTLSNVILATLFVRFIVLPSTLQVLDWTRSTFSSKNKGLPPLVIKKCNQKSPPSLTQDEPTNVASSGESLSQLQQDTAQHNKQPQTDYFQDFLTGRFPASASAPKTLSFTKPHSSSNPHSFSRPRSAPRKLPPSIQTGWRNSLQPDQWRPSPIRQGLGFFKRRTGMISPQLRRKARLSQLRPPKISTAPPPQPPLRPKKAVRVFLNPEVRVFDQGSPHQSSIKPISPTSPVDLDTPVSPDTIPDPSRNHSKVVTVAHLRQLRDKLLEIERRIAEMSSQPACIDAQAMRTLRDEYQAAIDDISFFGRTDDLRVINGAFFESMGNLLNSAISHLQQVTDSFLDDQQWLDLYQAVFNAAQDIASELYNVRNIVTSQVRNQGHIQQDVTVDGITERITVGEV